MHHRGLLRNLIYIFALAIIPSFVTAQNSVLGEYEVKAQFIFHFPSFISRKANNESNKSTFCTIGNDPFLSELENLQKLPDSNSITEIHRKISLSNVDWCDILFISNSEEDNFNKILIKIRKKPILTIGEFESFAERGGMIQFITDNKKVSFIINYKAGLKADIVISADLLKIAKQVIN